LFGWFYEKQKKFPFFANPEINQGIKDNRVMMKNALPCKKKKNYLLDLMKNRRKLLFATHEIVLHKKFGILI
jgi:hypothetical protein